MSPSPPVADFKSYEFVVEYSGYRFNQEVAPETFSYTPQDTFIPVTTFDERTALIVNRYKMLGKTLPAFNILSLNQNQVLNFPEKNNKITLLYYWASWHKESVTRLKWLEDIYMRNNELISVIGIHHRVSGSNEETQLQIFTKNKITFPCYYDFEGNFSKTIKTAEPI